MRSSRWNQIQTVDGRDATDAFLMQYFKLCGKWITALEKDNPQPAQENIWICWASPASYQIISRGGFMGQGSVLKDS